MMRGGGSFFWSDHMYGYGFERYWPYGMIIFAVIGILLLVGGILLINKRNKRHHSSDALEVLKMRYVNGEIDDEAYDKMKKTLS